MPRFIFRLTHFRNVERFLIDRAIYSKNHLPLQKCYRTSYSDIVERRGGGELNPPCGSNLNDFVSFYFSPSTAMAYAIYQGRVSLVCPENQDLGVANMDDIVFFVCSTDSISNSGLEYWFSNVACNSRAQIPEYESNLRLLEQHIQWQLFDEDPKMALIPEIGYNGVCKYFLSRDDGIHNNRKAIRMAEFLVKDRLPIELTTCIVVKNVGIQDEINQMLIRRGIQIPVHVKPGCYFR